MYGYVFFCSLNAVWALASAGFRIISDMLVFKVFCTNCTIFKPLLVIARLRLHASELSICLSITKMQKKCDFLQKLSNLELWCLLRLIGSYVSLTGLFKEPINGSLQSKMAEIHHLENRHDIIILCRGWSDLDKILQTGTE